MASFETLNSESWILKPECQTLVRIAERFKQAMASLEASIEEKRVRNARFTDVCCIIPQTIHCSLLNLRPLVPKPQ